MSLTRPGAVRLRCLGIATWLCCASCESSSVAPLVTLVDEGALRAKVSACLGLNGAQSVTLFWPDPEEGLLDATTLRSCVAAALGCADVLACAGYQPELCEGDRCEGSVAVRCRRLATGSTVAERNDCGATNSENRSCSVVDDLKEGRMAFCHGATCSKDHCEGDVKIRCQDGLSVRQDCAAVGRLCREASDAASCALPETCTADRCDGATINLCQGGHVQFKQRCDELVPDSRCVDESGFVECSVVSRDPRCERWGEWASWCEGTSAFTCIAGAVFQVDCGALEGGTCHAELVGTGDVASRARCDFSQMDF